MGYWVSAKLLKEVQVESGLFLGIAFFVEAVKI